MFKNDPNKLTGYLWQFVNVKEKPNYFYFNLFNSLMKSLDIKVVYIIVPTPNYRQVTLSKYGHDKVWNRIKDHLKMRPIEFWDFDNGKDIDDNSLQYIDENHLSYNSAKKFTKIIKKKLINKKDK